MYFNFKNRIFIHKFFVLLPAALLCEIPGDLYFFTFLFAFIHEAAHFTAAFLSGEKISRIFINPYGFELRIAAPHRKNEVEIILAGPAASLFLAVVFVVFGNKYFSKINFILFAINLIPAIPLDGGRLLKIFLWENFGAIRGNVILKRLSFAAAALLMVASAFLLNIWLFAISCLIILRSRRLAASPFYKKRCDKAPVRFYYFEKNMPLTHILHFVSPYDFVAVITPESQKVIFEWDIIEKLEKGGFDTYLSDFFT